MFIEFQNGWLDATAPLNKMMQDRPQFDDAVANAKKIIERARMANACIVHAGLSLTEDPDYLIFARGKDKSGLKGAIPRAIRRSPRFCAITTSGIFT